MKHPLKLSKSNKMYVVIAAVLIIIFTLINYGFNLYAFGYSLGYSLMIVLIPIGLASVYPLKKIGVVVFNVVLTIVLLVSIIKFVQTSKNTQEPKNNIQNEVTINAQKLN